MRATFIHYRPAAHLGFLPGDTKTTGLEHDFYQLWRERLIREALTNHGKKNTECREIARTHLA